MVIVSTPIRKLRKVLIKSWGFFHIIVIFLTALSSTVSTFNEFYNKNVQLGGTLNYIGNVLGNKAIRIYTIMSGTETGYGFYAPNVASSFVIHFVTKDKGGNTLSSAYSPNFQNFESYNKYSTCIGIFFAKIKKNNSDDFSLKCMNAVAKTFAEKYLAIDANASSITMDVYLYDYPSLKEWKKGMRKPQLFFIYEYKDFV